MNVFKNISLAATALALPVWAAQAMAKSAPTYHVDQGATYYVGDATISATDVCKFKQTYENASWGNVYDDGNNSVGVGLVSTEGQLLALLNSEPTQVSGIETSHKMEQTNYVDAINEGLSELIGNATESEACYEALLIPDAKSRMTTTLSEDSEKAAVEIQFDGIAQPKSVSTSGAFLHKKQLFSGKITFKGKTIPMI